MRVALLVAVMSMACDPGAHSGRFEGRPLTSMRCRVAADFAALGTETQLGVALAWLAPDGAGVTPLAAPVELVEDDPPLDLWAELRSSPPPHIALERGGDRVTLGQLVYFRDEDGDGRWSPEDEAVLALTVDTVLAFSETGFDVYERRIPPGFASVNTLPCSEGVPGLFNPSATAEGGCHIAMPADPGRPFFNPFCAFAEDHF